MELYLSSHIAQRSHTFDATRTDAESISLLSATNDLILLFDEKANSQHGGIFLFALQMQAGVEPLFEVDYLDGGDLAYDGSLINLNIAGADLSYVTETGQYRLYISCEQKGVFLVQFSYGFGETDITIETITLLDVPKSLKEAQKTMPSDADFKSVKVSSSKYDSSLRKSS